MKNFRLLSTLFILLTALSFWNCGGDSQTTPTTDPDRIWTIGDTVGVAFLFGNDTLNVLVTGQDRDSNGYEDTLTILFNVPDGIKEGYTALLEWRTPSQDWQAMAQPYQLTYPGFMVFPKFSGYDTYSFRLTVRNTLGDSLVAGPEFPSFANRLLEPASTNGSSSSGTPSSSSATFAVTLDSGIWVGSFIKQDTVVQIQLTLDLDDTVRLERFYSVNQSCKRYEQRLGTWSQIDDTSGADSLVITYSRLFASDNCATYGQGTALTGQSDRLPLQFQDAQGEWMRIFFTDAAAWVGMGPVAGR